MLLMRFGYEPEPGAIVSGTAASGCVSMELCHENLPFDPHTPARGISGNLARKMPREVQLEDGAAPLSLEHERSTPGCPLRCRGSSTRATSAWVLMPAHSRLRPPPPQHLGTTGWAGDKPAAFNSGFMAATDPKLTFRHYSV